jgi:hypothetical protein
VWHLPGKPAGRCFIHYSLPADLTLIVPADLQPEEQRRLPARVCLAALQPYTSPGSAGPAVIKSLDDLRLAGVLKVSLPVPPKLLQGKAAGLTTAWAAALPEWE